MTSDPELDFTSVNTLWCSVLVATLARCGVRQAVISPGSRSAPLACALARQSAIEAISVLDERSAAFFALGVARRHHRPTMLVCTSGTAAANYFPAIIEASEAGVPLLVLTADRPPELRDCRSGQTIDQQKIYGGYVRFAHEVALPEATGPQLAYLRQLCVHAYRASLRDFPGPVHLNCPFRDPLAPLPDAFGAELAALRDGPFFRDYFPEVAEVIPSEPLAAVPPIPAEVHGIIVAGPHQTDDHEQYCMHVSVLATKLGWPVLADALSPLRHRAKDLPTLVTTYDAILRHPEVAERLRPERVLCLHGWPVSKVLRGFLQAANAPTLMVGDGGRNGDALHGRTRFLSASLRVLATQLPMVADPNGYQQLWASYEERARADLDARLDGITEMFEGRATWLLPRLLPADTPVFVANSMPARDADYFWGPNDRDLRPFFNRGANGIDGTLATALGVAHGGRPTVLLTGDLALLHDTNGFLLPPRLSGSLTIILINNRGGGIFEHLPIAEFEPPFEEFFATPQHVDFAKLCAAYSVPHTYVRDWNQFVTLVATLPEGGIRVLEVRTNRKRDAAMRKGLLADVAAALA